jgi:hypothetical protein
MLGGESQSQQESAKIPEYLIRCQFCLWHYTNFLIIKSSQPKVNDLNVAISSEKVINCGERILARSDHRRKRKIETKDNFNNCFGFSTWFSPFQTHFNDIRAEVTLRIHLKHLEFSKSVWITRNNEIQLIYGEAIEHQWNSNARTSELNQILIWLSISRFSICSRELESDQ